MALDLETLDGTTDPAKLLQLLKTWDEEESSRYAPLHREWEKNVLFFLGKQWIEEKKGVDGFIILEEDDEHFRPVFNYTAKLCDLKRSQVLGKNIRPVVRANSDQKTDIESARLGNLVLRAKDEIDDEEFLRNRAFLHAEVFGITWRADFKEQLRDQVLEQAVMDTEKTEFFQCLECGYVDGDSSTCKKCGNPQMQFVRDMQERPVLNQDGTPQIQQIPLYTNGVAIVDPFRIKISPASEMKKLRWITDSSMQAVSWVKAQFNQEGSGFKGKEAVHRVKKSTYLPRGLKVSRDFETAVTKAHSATGRDVIRWTKQDKVGCDETVLHRSYFEPTKQYRRGRLIFWTEHAVLYDGSPDLPENPKLRRWHPYTAFTFREHPLRLEGIPFIEDLIPENKKINAYDAMILEHMEKTATPERVEFDNVQMNVDDASDGIIRVKGEPNLPNGGLPTYLQHPQMATEVYNQREKSILNMEKLAGVTEVVQGLRPAGVDTYRGLQLLRDAADSSEAELYNRWYKFLRDSAMLKLAIIQECLITEDPELVDLMEQTRQNENMGLAEVKTFLGQDLRNNLNVKMEEADYISLSKSAEADQVKDSIAAGVVLPMDMEDPYTRLKLLRRLGMSWMPFSDKADIEKAERIVQMWEAGDVQTPMRMMTHMDNKALFLRVWSDWVKSPKFESLPPPQQQAILGAIKSVEDELLASMQVEQSRGVQPPAGERRLAPVPTGAAARQ